MFGMTCGKFDRFLNCEDKALAIAIYGIETKNNALQILLSGRSIFEFRTATARTG
jgi:hypothetical protein